MRCDMMSLNRRDVNSVRQEVTRLTKPTKFNLTTSDVKRVR